MTLAITPLYAAPLVLVFIALSVHVLTYRRSHRIVLGDAGDRELLNRIRAHGNFTE